MPEIVATSGTSGVPKQVLLSDAAIAASTDAANEALGGAGGELPGPAAVVPAGLLAQVQGLAIDGEQPGTVLGPGGGAQGEEAAAAAAEVAGRAYAAYGGIYIAASLAWLWSVEGLRPDRWDLAGATLCLAGAAVIVAGPR